jgi:hypothetical protein
MEKDQPLNPEESLALIYQTIAQTKVNLKQHSFIFLLWGWLLAFASIIRFFLQTQTNFTYYFIPFPILAGIGLIATLIFYCKKSQPNRETHLNYFIKNLWMVLIIGFIAAVFVSVYQNIEPFTYTLLIAGIGTLVSGIIMKYKPLIFGGICLLTASVLCVFVSSEYKVLIHGIAIILGYLIPGYLLKNTKV